MIRRFRAMETRWKGLIIGLAIAVTLGITGVWGSLNDVDVTEDEAISIASEYLDFEPEVTETRIVRQGFSRLPVWGVNFYIPDPDGGGDFVRHLIVEIDGRSGDVLTVGDDGKREDS